MSTPVVATDRDLRALAAIVSEERDDLPEGGLPLSLLSDLAAQISCDYVLFQGYDTERENYWFAQQVPDDDDADPHAPSDEESHRAFWEQFWGCRFCSYPDRTGDLRSVF